MAKSKAQRMKEYRARKKEKLGDQWLKQERMRTKAYFIPIALMSEEDKEKRRMQNRSSAQTYYNKHKKINTSCTQDDAGQSTENESHIQTESFEDGVSSTTNDEPLTVKFEFSRASGSGSKSREKRVSRELKRTKRKVDTLEDKNEELRKKLRSAQKRLQRYDLKRIQNRPNTPRSKSDAILKQSGMKPKEVPEVRKRLIYAECLSQEIIAAVRQNPNTHSSIHKVISGRVIKKYRLKSYLQKSTDLNRRKKVNDKEMILRKKRILTQRSEKMKVDVILFLNRDDNSRMMPGKGDAVKLEKGKVQKRVLNDYLHNLHLKFKAETSYTVSLATFCWLRPKYLSLVNFASRSVCLCTKHQNFSFKLRAMKNAGLTTTTSPDVFVDMYKNAPAQFDEMLQSTPDTMKYQIWKRVKLQNGKERMKIVENQVAKAEFISAVKKEFDLFVGHVERVSQQYKSLKIMKDKLPDNHILIQMDFSENYNCKTVEEIQSAYWNPSMVTLHPTILYFNNTDGSLGHKSMVFVSEVLHHNAAMVSAIVDHAVKTAKTLIPNLQHVHFWTDSPSSQYRNKSVFDMINSFEDKFGCKASWHYFEAGHGKSACDGVGGTTKRNADNAVKQNKAVIQDAPDFFAWAVQSRGEIQYAMITADEYKNRSTEIEKRKDMIKPIKGTMVLHSIARDRNGKLIKRQTTCACDKCFFEEGFDGTSSCGWDEVELIRQHKGDDSCPEIVEIDKEKLTRVELGVNDYVVALYDEKCYLGKVLETDEDDKTVHVDFMEKSGKIVKRFRWPSKEDRVWVNHDDILKRIDQPTATGKGGRMYSVPDEIIKFMESYDLSLINGTIRTVYLFQLKSYIYCLMVYSMRPL